jgi:hypothetical protein
MAESELEAIGYTYAMAIVEEMIQEMIDSGFDVATLEELRQKIRTR